MLVKLCQLVADFPEVRQLDLNPLLADEREVIALDARVAIAPVEPKLRGRGHPRFAVKPYPKEWEREVVLADAWKIFVRPVRPEDEPLFREFGSKVAAEDLRLRFFAPIKEVDHPFLARLTQLDYARAMALIAIDQVTGQMLGVVRLHADANYETGEFAILLRSDVKGRGLGWKLMELIISYARSEGLKQIEGQILRENSVMLAMCHELGFRIESDPDDPHICKVTLSLL